MSGLDPTDDAKALRMVQDDWGITLPPALWGEWDTILEHERPVIVNLFLAPGSYGDVVIRGGIACLGSTFGLLLGTGRDDAVE